MSDHYWDVAIWPDGSYHWREDGQIPSYMSDDYLTYAVPEGQDPDEFLEALLKIDAHRSVPR